MQLTDEEKKRLKILKILLRKNIHKGVRKGIKIAKKAGLVLGLTLISICGKAQNPTSFKNILALASSEQKSNVELISMIEKSIMSDSTAKKVVADEINAQIRHLAEDFLYARSDSLSSSIDKLKNPKTRTKEIRRNFKDATGISQISSHCLATQCAADYRALKAMGLEQIVPEDLKKSSALCRSYVRTSDVKPFAYEVANTDAAINKFIEEHNFSGGTMIFYPRGGGNYHAVSVDMPKEEFEYNDSIDEILTSGANREKKGVPVSTASFRAKAPGKKAVIVDKQSFFIALLENHLSGKTLAEQTAILYQGGADEFINHLYKVTNTGKEELLANIENIVLYSKNNKPETPRKADGLYLLAMVPLAYNRRSDKTLQAIETIENELNEFSLLEDKCEYLEGNLRKALSKMSKKEQEQFLGSLVFSSGGQFKMDQNTAAFAVYPFWKAFGNASQKANENEEIWHQVSNAKPKIKENTKQSKTKVASKQRG